MKDFNENSSILLESSCDSISVFNDKTRIRQVLLSLMTISLGYVLYRLSQHPCIEISLKTQKNHVKIVIFFNSLTNFSVGPVAVLKFIKKSLKIKISKKIAAKVCKKQLKIKNYKENFICFEFYLPLHKFFSNKILEIPDEGAILLPYSLSNYSNSEQIQFIDILIVDDIEFNIEILVRLINSLKDSCKLKKP